MWASFERQEYQARRAQRKSDPVAKSDLVDVDVGYPDDRETRNRLFEAASLASLYTSGFWLRSRLYCFGRMSAPSSALASEPYGSRKKQQGLQHLCQTRLPHGCQSKPLSGCQRTQRFLSLERSGMLEPIGGQVFAHPRAARRPTLGSSSNQALGLYRLAPREIRARLGAFFYSEAYLVTSCRRLPWLKSKLTATAEFRGLKCIYHLRPPPIWVLELDCEQRQTILRRERGHALLKSETRSYQFPKFISDHPTGVTGSIATFQRSAEPLKRRQRKKNRRKIRNTTIEQPNVSAGPLRHPQVFNASSFMLIRQRE